MRVEGGHGEQFRHGFTETRPRRKMSTVVGISIGHRSSGSISHGTDTWRRRRERPEDEVRGKADSSTNEVKNNRNTKGAVDFSITCVNLFLTWSCCKMLGSSQTFVKYRSSALLPRRM